MIKSRTINLPRLIFFIVLLTATRSEKATIEPRRDPQPWISQEQIAALSAFGISSTTSYYVTKKTSSYGGLMLSGVLSHFMGKIFFPRRSFWLQCWAIGIGTYTGSTLAQLQQKNNPSSQKTQRKKHHENRY